MSLFSLGTCMSVELHSKAFILYLERVVCKLTRCMVLCNADGVESCSQTRAVGEESYPLTCQLLRRMSVEKQSKPF
jgi:hypothetical protein